MLTEDRFVHSEQKVIKTDNDFSNEHIIVGLLHIISSYLNLGLFNSKDHLNHHLSGMTSSTLTITLF